MPEIASMYELIVEKAANNGTAREIAELDTEILQSFAASVDNLYLRLYANSIRPLQLSLTEKFLKTIDVQSHYSQVFKIFYRYKEGSLNMDQFEDEFGDYMCKVTMPLRDSFALLPVEPEMANPILPIRGELHPSNLLLELKAQI